MVGCLLKGYHWGGSDLSTSLFAWRVPGAQKENIAPCTVLMMSIIDFYMMVTIEISFVLSVSLCRAKFGWG